MQLERISRSHPASGYSGIQNMIRCDVCMLNSGTHLSNCSWFLVR